MGALLFLFPFLSFLLWLASIRPYCLKHKQGFTTGANWDITIWVDWQQAGEIARKEGDGGMIAVCRLFLGLRLFFELSMVLLLLGGL